MIEKYIEDVKRHAEPEEIVANIIYEARRIFRVCEAEDDFCVQHAGEESIVFGGWNRVRWGVRLGWVAFESHCSSEVLAAFKKLGFGKVVA